MDVTSVSDRYDVIVVGAGVAGSALASRLAQAGRSVLVLEQQESYRDRTRGETIMPWGVREVRQLGLEDVLLAAGGEYAEYLVLYDEIRSPEEAEAGALPYSLIAPDVPGELNVGHPEASTALSAHAAAVGATVLRGVRSVEISLDDVPSVTWSGPDGGHSAQCRLIVGADGRTSTVRRQLGIELQETAAVTFGAGLLVKGECGFTRRNTLGTSGQSMFFAFPRAEDLTRLYLFVAAERQSEFTGAGRVDAFRRDYPNASFPASQALAEAEVIGPCGGAPMTDSWTTTPPVRDGALLIGDAAGWNDPIIGQGLSIAMRDARSVAEVLESSDDWSPDAFKGYVEERAERMRRLAIAGRITTQIRCTFTEEGRQRRARWNEALAVEPVFMAQTVCTITGPEAFGEEAFTDEAIERVLAL